jgi:hypothetical protein
MTTPFRLWYSSASAGTAVVGLRKITVLRRQVKQNRRSAPDVVLTGLSSPDNFGGSVSPAGDVNGDGYDLAVAAADGQYAQVYHGSAAGGPDLVRRRGRGWRELSDREPGQLHSADWLRVRCIRL